MVWVAAAAVLGVSADSVLGLGLRESGVEEAGEAADHCAIAVENHDAGFVAVVPQSVLAKAAGAQAAAAGPAFRPAKTQGVAPCVIVLCYSSLWVLLLPWCATISGNK